MVHLETEAHEERRLHELGQEVAASVVCVVLRPCAFRFVSIFPSLVLTQLLRRDLLSDQQRPPKQLFFTHVFIDAFRPIAIPCTRPCCSAHAGAAVSVCERQTLWPGRVSPCSVFTATDRPHRCCLTSALWSRYVVSSLGRACRRPSNRTSLSIR